MSRTDVETINGWLEGSPYSFDSQDGGEELADELLRSQLEISQRAFSVRAAFEQQAQAIRTELERDFDLRLVFESNAIEGAGTSFEETKRFLQDVEATSDYLSVYTFGKQVEADPKLLEVVGHGSAVRFVHDLASGMSGGELREIDIRNLHHMVMLGEPRIAGSYKVMDNKIGGRSDLLTARSDDVSYHVHQLVDWMNRSKVGGPLAAAVVHAWIAYIHPFEDGNGRVARLMANFVLYKAKWPCLIVRSGPDRQQYYDALQHSDEGGDIAPLFSLFGDGLNRSLTEMSDPDFARSLVATDLDRQNKFELWSGLQSSFTSRLHEAIHRQGGSLEVVGHLDEGAFAWLQRRDPAGNAWFAKVRGLPGVPPLLLWFGYQSDQMRSVAKTATQTPSIFVSVRDGSDVALHPYRPLWEHPDLDVHELSLQPKAAKERAIVRWGSEVREIGLEAAASELAKSLAQLGTSGPRGRPGGVTRCHAHAVVADWAVWKGHCQGGCGGSSRLVP